MVWKTLNLNENVRFKLSPVGERIWTKHYRQFVTKADEPVLPRKDGEWYIAQLWTIMNVFGRHMTLTAHPPIEMDIMVNVYEPLGLFGNYRVPDQRLPDFTEKDD